MNHVDLIKKIKPMPGVDTKPILSAADHYISGITDKPHYRRMYRVGIRGYLTQYAARKTTGDPGAWVVIEHDWRKTPEAAVNSWNRFVQRIIDAAKRGEG